MSAAVVAIVVTHNSPPVLRRTIEALLKQTVRPTQIVIVDSGSSDPVPVKALEALDATITVICRENIGFAASNNLAMREYAGECDYFALVNPDAILASDWIAGALAYCDGTEGRDVGIVSSPLRGMDATTEQPTGLWDTLGIYRNWMGRWYDRGMRQPIGAIPGPSAPYEPIAIVGALMFFSRNTYRVITGANGFFDERFHTFKEDIELSLRVHRAGYRLVMLPDLIAYHCRGWPKRRSQASYWARKLSARNDALIALKYFPAALPLYLLKYVYVTSFERLLLAIAPK